jgi:hypothetical protein
MSRGTNVRLGGGQLVFYSGALAVTVLGAGVLVGMYAAGLGGTYRFAAAAVSIGGFVLAVLVSIGARVLGWLPMKRRIRDLVSRYSPAEIVAAWQPGSPVRAIVFEPGEVELWGMGGDQPLGVYSRDDALEIQADGRSIRFTNSDSTVSVWPRVFAFGEYVPVTPPQVHCVARAIRAALAEPQPNLPQRLVGD